MYFFSFFTVDIAKKFAEISNLRKKLFNLDRNALFICKNSFNLDRNGRFDTFWGFTATNYRNGLPQRIDLRITANHGNENPLRPGFRISKAGYTDPT